MYNDLSRAHIPRLLDKRSNGVLSSRRKSGIRKIADPPPLNAPRLRQETANEPIVAFGPPGTAGELNVSVIVSRVLLDFSIDIEAFGGPKEVEEAILRTIVAASRRPDVRGTLVASTLREDSSSKGKYYQNLKSEGAAFRRHNVNIGCSRRGKLFTLNAQSPKFSWLEVESNFYTIADSFKLIA